MSRPAVVHPEQATPEPGEKRRLYSDVDGRWIGWAGWIQNEAREVSDWHHHAANDTYVYVIRGSVTIDFGRGGAESIVARAGDIFIVPSQTIHRETTSPDTDLEPLIVRVGGEPEHVGVDGPEAAEGRRAASRPRS